MATVTGDLNFWNITGDSIFKQVWLSAGNSKTISRIVAISVIILSPIIVFGNLLVVFFHSERPHEETLEMVI